MAVISRLVLKEEPVFHDDEDQVSEAEVEDLDRDEGDFDDEKDMDDEEDDYDDDDDDSQNSADDQSSESHASSLNNNGEGQENSPSVIVTEEFVEEPKFVSLYTGPGTQFEAKHLEPATVYQFRVCAVNNAGPSDWSNSVEVREIDTMYQFKFHGRGFLPWRVI